MGLPYVMWSAHFFVTNIQTENISSWNGPTVHVCCFMLARASTRTFVSESIFVSRVRKHQKNPRYPKNSLAESLVSRGVTVLPKDCKSEVVFPSAFQISKHRSHLNHWSFLIKRVIKGKVEVRIEVMRRRRIRSKQLPYYLKKTRMYWKLKVVTLD
jgi:hypothetical protein